MTEVFTLPKPEFKTPGLDYNGKPARTRKVHYPVGPVTKTDKGTEQRVVQVWVGHTTDRKEFYARANRVVVANEAPFWAVERSMLFNGVTLMRQPVARYSVKALEAFTAKVVELFEAQVAVTPVLRAMFNEDEGEWA
jgi:hypothetical protein